MKRYTLLLYASINLSNAITMDGYCGLGAEILMVNLASFMAFDVVAPKDAMSVLFCLNFGKFSYSDRISAGLKKTMMS